MDKSPKQRLRERLFRISVSLKGLDAALELVSGAALYIISPGFILRAVAFVTLDELAEDPRDLVANYALEFAKHLSVGTEHFTALYLLIHGVIKLLLVAALLRDMLWAYPIAIIVFFGFIAYQLYRFTFTHSVGLIGLSLFDLVVIVLIWLEYRALKRETPAST